MSSAKFTTSDFDIADCDRRQNSWQYDMYQDPVVQKMDKLLSSRQVSMQLTVPSTG